MGLAAGQSPGPPRDLATTTVGQVTAIARPADMPLAVGLAERADQPAEWYGLGRRAAGPLALMVVRGDSAFRAVARGRVPAWGAGLALPGARFILVRADGDDPLRVLRHEVAHLVLHDGIRGRVPLWFDEGYAAVAAGEFGRFDRLGLNLTVALGRVPGFEALNAGLRAGPSTAETSYALAAAGVSFLDRRAGGIEPVLTRLAAGMPFDSAVLVTTGLNPGRFEEAWQRDLKRRYGLGLWLGAGGLWAVVAGLVVAAHFIRKRRDRPRREQLNLGWTLPTEPPEAGDPVPAPEAGAGAAAKEPPSA